MEIRLLGSGGWMPTDRRETACIALRDGPDLLLLDAGTGVRRLATEPELLDGVERLHIVLTHFHLDHTYGLMVMPALKRVAVREVWAPGLAVAGVAARQLIDRLLAPPFLAGKPEDVTSELVTAVHELEDEAEVGPFRVETRLQRLHNWPSVAVRVNGELAYCTDTAYDPENAPFARGARVLLHEAFHAADETGDTQHSAAGEAGRVAADAGVERLVLVHVSPLGVDEDALGEHARARFPVAEVGRDGLVV